MAAARVGWRHVKVTTWWRVVLVCANADSLDQKHETGPPATGGRGRRSSCRRKSCVNREARELRFHGSINIKYRIEYIPIVPIGTVTG